MSFTDTKVEPGLKYLYRLAGVNSAGEGPKSSPVTLIVPGERLEAPADLAAVYTEQGMEVTWSAPTNAGTTDYQVYRGKFRADGEDLDGGVSKYANIPADSDPMTYLDTNVDEGAKYRYRVAAVNATGEGFKTTWLDVQATSSETDVPTAATGAPTISGIVRVGETLTADTSLIADEDGLEKAVFSYQWIRSDGTADTHIANATGVSYTLVSDDEGKTIKVEVGFTDDEGNPESLTSEPTEAVAAVNQLATGQPVIVGIVRVGQTLTADTSGDRRCRRSGERPQLQLSMAQERRDDGHGDCGRKRLQLHLGRGRPGRHPQGPGVLHRQPGLLGNPHQRAHRDGRAGEPPGHGRAGASRVPAGG